MPRKNRANRMSFDTPPEVEEDEAIEQSDAVDQEQQDEQEPEQETTESDTAQGLPQQAQGPASSPSSSPQAAGSEPATSTPQPKRRGPIDFTARAAPCPPLLAQMNEAQRDKYHDHSAEYAESMTQLVPCQAVEPISGRIGLRFTFSFKRADVIFLPRWFALTYPQALVIKE